jgi:hypothetical protein
MNHQIFERTLRFRDTPGSMPVRVSVTSTHPSLVLARGLWAVLGFLTAARAPGACGRAATRSPKIERQGGSSALLSSRRREVVSWSPDVARRRPGGLLTALRRHPWLEAPQGWPLPHPSRPSGKPPARVSSPRGKPRRPFTPDLESGKKTR